MVGQQRRVHGAVVLEHCLVEVQRLERGHALQLGARIADQILVAQLEVALAGQIAANARAVGDDLARLTEPGCEAPRAVR
jgi:hypothetical protein